MEVRSTEQPLSIVHDADTESLQLKHKESDNRGTQWNISPQEEKSGRQAHHLEKCLYRHSLNNIQRKIFQNVTVKLKEIMKAHINTEKM